MTGLSRSKQEYLKTIHTLARGGAGACVTDIAARMAVTKASASRAVSELASLGLAYRAANRRVGLTPQGLALVRELSGRYDVIYRFLREVLRLSCETSAGEACALEHLLGEDSVCAMRRMLGA